MSYEDLKEAQEKRAVKEAKKADKTAKKAASAALEAEGTTTHKGKRGRKRKSPIFEAGTPVSVAKAARIGEALEIRATVAQMSGTQVPGNENSPELWRAPVARIW